MKEIITYGRFRCAELMPHKNRGMEITYIEKGALEWMVEGVVEKIPPGSIYFTLPWQVHGSVHPKEPANTLWHVLFQLDGDYPAPRTDFKFPKALGFSREEARVLSTVFARSRRHCFPATPALRGLMPALIAELQSTHELRTAHAVTLLRAVLVELKRVIGKEVVDSGRLTPTERRVRSLIESLPARCDESWTLADMAERCGVQRTQLSKIFQNLTGGTPMEYLARIRMERAKTLLRETDMKIIDIALECGYGSSQYFANAFKASSGETPSEYRKTSGALSAAESRDWRNVRFRTVEEERRRVETFSENEPSKA